MRSPVKKEHITQAFGKNPQIYSKFDLDGHNGLDFRAFKPDGSRCYTPGFSEVFAPHDGKIIENLYSNGYGYYIKIENKVEGSVLAHLSEPSVAGIGTEVKEGQFIGYQGNTGFSTAIHLHWGYYLFPRDRSNGYNGYINQAGLYLPYEGGDMTDLEVCLAQHAELVTGSIAKDKKIAELEKEIVELKKHKCPIVPEGETYPEFITVGTMKMRANGGNINGINYAVVEPK